MKKIIFLVFCCLFATSASANHIGIALHNHPIVDTHTHSVAHRAQEKANIALFVGVSALMVATVGVLKASEYNSGHIQIARF